MMKFLSRPLLLIAALVICLGMIRLGIWQLDRAAEKQEILSEVLDRAALPPISIVELTELDLALSDQRFRNVTVSGRYLPDKSLYLDNQVSDSKVGYRIFTPFEVTGTEKAVLIDRGWIAVGDSRSIKPQFMTPTGGLILQGRINNPPEKPPLWDDSYPVASDDVWQYLPLEQVAQTLQLELVPMVVELPPVSGEPMAEQFKRQWQTIDDRWVATHHGYAFQWFAMAFVFFAMCMVMFVRSIRTSKMQ
jgi:surfeit locus 1 family protein